MATKFGEFLTAKGIDSRRLIATSRQVERLRPEDRRVRLERRLARAEESSGADKKKFPKTRSGRPLTLRQVEDATSGRPLSGPTKTRVLRAVNRVLEQKKQESVTLQSLF
jgi:hypothetical protein